MNPLPTLRQFYSLFPTEQHCVDFLIANRVFYSSIDCSKCQKPMKKYENLLTFRCTTHSCNGKRISMKIHTFFYESKLKCNQIMELGLLWLHGSTVSSAISLTGCSPNTVTNFYKHFRQLVSCSISEEDVTIGGPNIIVELDETKLGKRKYNRGHRVDGTWVFVGIERTAERKLFAITVEDRSAKTLIPLILKHVMPGSIIYSDKWRAYSSLNELGYFHYSVNHSETYVNDETGACTNSVKGTNNALKMKIPVRNRVKENLEFHLFEFIWRRKNNSRLFPAFVDCLRDIHYDYE